MNQLVEDNNRNIVILINDYWPEYGTALEKLSQRLGRPLKGVLLVDMHVKEAGRNFPDPSGRFETIVCDFSHLRSISDALNPIADKVLLVASSSERNQPYLKKALPHLPYVNGPSESSLDWATHKATMRELMRSFNGALAPKSETVHEHTEDDIQRVLRNLDFPLIVKPNGLAASILVNRANNEEELREFLSHSFEVIDKIYARDKGRGKPSILCEEFIEGDMYSVDSYINSQGDVWSLPLVKVTTAYAIGKEGFYSYQLDTALDLTEQDIKEAHETARQAMLSLGLRSTVGHIEMFKTVNGWKLIELGPRAGGYRQDMYELGHGIDHAYNEFLVKIDLEPEVTPTKQSYCSCLNMYADEEGVIESIEGFEEAQNNPSVFRLTAWLKPGDMALNCGNGGKYIIDGVLHNDSLDQLNKDLEDVRNTIKITTVPVKEVAHV